MFWDDSLQPSTRQDESSPMPRSQASPSFEPDRLKQLRDERGLTQAELAERAGVARTYVVYWEGGTYTPTPANLLVLAEALEVAPHELTAVEPDQATLGDLRLWSGLNRSQLAERLGVSPPTLRSWETGVVELPPERINQLASLLEVTSEDIRAAASRSTA